MSCAVDVAERVVHPGVLATAVSAVASRTRYPRTARWVPADVAQGDAGLALLCGELDRVLPREGWDERAHRLMVSATDGLSDVPVPPALFGGLAGLGFVAERLGRDGTRYRQLAGAVDGALVPQTRRLAELTHERRGRLSVGHFDVIAGLAGIAAYLLLRRGRAEVDEALDDALHQLAGLALTSGDPLPGWHTRRELLYDDATRARYPAGNLNCGLAHGIPGPLAALALAAGAEVQVDGWREALAGVAGWLVDQRVDDEWGPSWPVAVQPGVPAGRHEVSRTAWCYGAPGVARALWLAGSALDDHDLTGFAVEAMAAVYRRPVRRRLLASPTFCHGAAGLLQISLRFAHDTGLPLFRQAVVELTDQLLEQYEPASLLGFRAVEPDGTRVDQAGLLDGAPGVALVLLAAATDDEPGWDRLFLLA